MSPSLAATLGPSAYWYLTRGSGAVALVLLTLSVVLGDRRVAARLVRSLAAVRGRYCPPRRLAAGDRRARDPHHHQRARRVRADLAGRGRDPVRHRLPAAVARLRGAGVRPPAGARDHEPAQAPARVPDLARGALARVRELADRGPARPRDRQRHEGLVDAAADGRLRGGRDGRGLLASRRRRATGARYAGPGDPAQPRNRRGAGGVHGRRSVAEGLGPAGRDTRQPAAAERQRRRSS